MSTSCEAPSYVHKHKVLKKPEVWTVGIQGPDEGGRSMKIELSEQRERK